LSNDELVKQVTELYRRIRLGYPNADRLLISIDTKRGTAEVYVQANQMLQHLSDDGIKGGGSEDDAA
jgi:hypothetical protein